MRFTWLLAAILTAQAVHLLCQVAPYVPEGKAASAACPCICIIIRTYWGHGDGNSSELRDLLRSFQVQAYTKWEALLLVLDSRPFSQLPRILSDLRDDRVWVYAELVDELYTPRKDATWTSGYHERLYNLTDEAVRACPTNTRWVLVTNGDNAYADSFFDALLRAPADADVIAFDYYSRYRRSTGPPCLRFQSDVATPPCKRNKMQWCHTDLGANVYSWQRLLREDRRFGAPTYGAEGFDAEHFDGVMASSVLADGWSAHHVAHACLFDHSPSPQRCARSGGIWDDSRAVASELGGACLTAKDAERRLEWGGGALQLVAVELGITEAGQWQDSKEQQPSKLLCIRQMDARAQHHASMLFFGEVCAEDEDLPELQTFLTTEAATLAGASVLTKVQAVAAIQQRHSGPTDAVPAAPLDRRPPLPPPGGVGVSWSRKEEVRASGQHGSV